LKEKESGAWNMVRNKSCIINPTDLETIPGGTRRNIALMQG
jgi:hypothetical protein